MLPTHDAPDMTVELLQDIPGMGKAGATLTVNARQAVRWFRGGRAKAVAAAPAEKRETRAQTTVTKKSAKRKTYKKKKKQ